MHRRFGCSNGEKKAPGRSQGLESSRVPGGGTKRHHRIDFGGCAKFFSMPLSRVASGEADTIAGWLRRAIPIS